MSRYVSVRTQIRDMGMLRRTLQCMGLAIQEGRGQRLLPGRRQAELVVQTPAGPIGFAQAPDGVVTAIGMEEALRTEACRKFVGQVTQQYARQKVLAEAERAGFRLVEETVDAGNTIRLVVRKW